MIGLVTGFPNTQVSSIEVYRTVHSAITGQITSRTLREIGAFRVVPGADYGTSSRSARHVITPRSHLHCQVRPTLSKVVPPPSEKGRPEGGGEESG